jgi:hypothetical protein
MAAKMGLTHPFKPEVVRSDQDSAFVSHHFKEFLPAALLDVGPCKDRTMKASLASVSALAVYAATRSTTRIIRTFAISVSSSTPRRTRSVNATAVAVTNWFLNLALAMTAPVLPHGMAALMSTAAAPVVTAGAALCLAIAIPLLWPTDVAARVPRTLRPRGGVRPPPT